MCGGGWGDVCLFSRVLTSSVCSCVCTQTHVCVYAAVLFVCLFKSAKESVCAREEKKRGRIVKSPPRDERDGEREGGGGRGREGERKRIAKPSISSLIHFIASCLLRLGLKRRTDHSYNISDRVWCEVESSISQSHLTQDI